MYYWVYVEHNVNHFLFNQNKKMVKIALLHMSIFLFFELHLQNKPNHIHQFHRCSANSTIQFHRTNSTTRSSRFTKMFCGRKSNSTSVMDFRWISLANKWKVIYILINVSWEFNLSRLYTVLHIAVSLCIPSKMNVDGRIISVQGITMCVVRVRVHRSFNTLRSVFLFDVVKRLFEWYKSILCVDYEGKMFSESVRNELIACFLLNKISGTHPRY